MIIGMPIITKNNYPLQSIYYYTETITINRMSYDFSLYHQLTLIHYLSGGIWIQWDNQMELGKNVTVLKIVFEKLLSVWN